MGGMKIVIIPAMMILSFALLLLLLCPPAAGREDGASPGAEAVRERRHPIVEAAMALFSLPTAFPYAPSYWLKLSSFFKQGLGFFFTAPNLDFRGSGGVAKGAEEEGTGEKVKDAAVKSKAAMEESAKSAAKLAGEAVDKAAKNLKMTLSRTSSHQDDNDDDDDEL